MSGLASLGGVDLLQTQTGGWARPNVKTVVPLIGDGVTLTGNAVLQSGALGFQQSPISFSLDLRTDVETLQGYDESAETVIYVDHEGETFGVVVLDFSATMAGFNLWDCQATLLIIEETYS